MLGLLCLPSIPSNIVFDVIYSWQSATVVYFSNDTGPSNKSTAFYVYMDIDPPSEASSGMYLNLDFTRMIQYSKHLLLQTLFDWLKFNNTIVDFFKNNIRLLFFTLFLEMVHL
mgnify:CR=1 FL=1